MVIATLLHPSRETATTIVASEPRLVAAHAVYTLAWLLVLLGLPGLYAAQRGGMGRLGLVGLLIAFSGTYLIAVTGNFGFLGPALAKQAPAVLDSLSQYLPVVIINGLAAILCRVHCSSWPSWRAPLFVTAAMAFPRQIGGTDEAARGGWWSDYAEHATALAGVLATSRGPGGRILRRLCSAV
jgi:hypothetical protein